MRWWSRIYEYQWLTDVVEAFFGSDRSGKTVLDAACGPAHPGCFMLADMGFARVRAVDPVRQPSDDGVAQAPQPELRQGPTSPSRWASHTILSCR
jgi:hypothetical protein